MVMKIFLLVFLCQLDGSGMKKVIELNLNDEERSGLANSVDAVKSLMASLEAMEY